MTKLISDTEVAAIENEAEVKVVESGAFDVAAGLAAAKEVTPTTRSGALKDFSANIIALFEAAQCPLSVQQVRAAFAANGQKYDSKKFADRLWVLAKAGKLEHAGVGMYKLAD